MANGNVPPLHYYGDIVRKLFLGGGTIMLVTLPFVNNRLPVSLQSSILIILVMDIFAGFTNPMSKWIVVIDTAMALVGFLVFEYYAVMIYLAHSYTDILFWTNGTLGIIFFFALYFSTKTFRGSFFK